MIAKRGKKSHSELLILLKDGAKLLKQGKKRLTDLDSSLKRLQLLVPAFGLSHEELSANVEIDGHVRELIYQLSIQPMKVTEKLRVVLESRY